MNKVFKNCREFEEFLLDNLSRKEYFAVSDFLALNEGLDYRNDIKGASLKDIIIQLNIMSCDNLRDCLYYDDSTNGQIAELHTELKTRISQIEFTLTISLVIKKLLKILDK